MSKSVAVFSVAVPSTKKLKGSLLDFVIALYVIKLLKLPKESTEQLNFVASEGEVEWLGDMVCILQKRIPRVLDFFPSLLEIFRGCFTIDQITWLMYGNDGLLEQMDTSNLDQDPDFQAFRKVKVPVEFQAALQQAIKAEFDSIKKRQVAPVSPLMKFDSSQRLVLVNAARILQMTPDELIASNELIASSKKRG